MWFFWGAMTIKNQIAILHPVACCISFESMSRAMHAGQVSVDDIHNAASDAPDSVRVKALARMALATNIADTEADFESSDDFDAVVEAISVARGVLA